MAPEADASPPASPGPVAAAAQGLAPSPATLEPGQSVDGFVLHERLHRGGMAALWKVSREGVAAPAIMKIPLLGDDPTAIVGFEVEQMILPLLRGPHVPRWIGAGGFESLPYIVMELLQGDSLRGHLERVPLPPADVADIGARIAEALHDLHQQQVIHHDIKPSNIMFRADGTVVLIDFGLARHDRLPDLLAEQFHLPMGTGPYISPEQVLHNRCDSRSDLFALGVILYYLATGERPFGAPTSVRGLRQRLYEEPVPPRALRPDFPPWLQEVILRCLEVDPERRYATAALLAFDLTHPEAVVLTARAQAARRMSTWRRWQRAVKRMASRPVVRSTTQQLNRAPIVVVALDLSQDWEALNDALRTAAGNVLLAAPEARLACVSVLKTNRIGMDAPVDESGTHRHVQRLVQLQHWARPLALPSGRVTFHVLEAPDPAAALLDYANGNRVGHIVMGSRGTSSLRRYLGSVSTQVVAQASCSVTVVKVPAAERGGEPPAPGAGAGN
jgi:nucleotide-binding universal stress UspA family protein